MKIKKNSFVLISELIFYILGILSIINPILIALNNGNTLRIPSGLLLSNLSAITAWDLVREGMLGSMAICWALIALFGFAPAIFMLSFGFLIRNGKKQALIVGIVLLIADSFILFSFLDNIPFLILNGIIRIIVLVLLIMGAKAMKAN